MLFRTLRHNKILVYNDYALPDIQGWGWEINGCHFDDDAFCESVAGDGDDWCDEDDGDADSDNDDNGRGTNDIISFTDAIDSPGCGNTQEIVRTWISTSSCNGADVTGDQTITIADDFPPRLGIIDDFFIECNPFGLDDSTLGSASAFDICGNVVLDVDIVEQSEDNCEQVYEVIFTATDPGDGTGECHTTIDSYFVTIRDTIPPTAIFGEEIIVDCDNIPLEADTEPTLVDNCPLSNTAPFIDGTSTRTIPGDCEGNFIERRTYTLSDGCGNTEDVTIDVHVVDIIPPTITPNFPPNYVDFIDCQENIVHPTFTAFDSCSSEDLQLTENFEYTETHENVLSTTITDTIVAVDGCGNIATRIYTVVVEENAFTSPFIVGPPTATKGVTFTVSVGYLTSSCAPSDITLVVDAGVAILISSSDPCFQQAASGLIYCDSNSAGLNADLNLQVPADYLPSLLRISTSAEVTGGFFAPIPASLNIRLV